MPMSSLPRLLPGAGIQQERSISDTSGGEKKRNRVRGPRLERAMRTNIPEKLLKVIAEIEADGHANLTRLTVLKKWFERPGRLAAFAVWVAARAKSRKGKTVGAAGDLFKEAGVLLRGVNPHAPELDREAAQRLHARLREFQDEYRKQGWDSVRMIQNWNLLLVEKGLAIYLRHGESPSDGYDLAADYCRHYDPHYGSGLSGPSRTKIKEIVQFMFTFEAMEDGRSWEEEGPG
jgi:hypothetical protein